MRDKIKEIIRQKLQELSSTGTGGATFTAGEGAQYADKYSFKKGTNMDGVKRHYYYKLGWKAVPKKIKGSGLEVKKLFEEDTLNEYNEFQQERINAFDKIEKEINSLLPILSNKKNETAEFYTANPGSYEVYTPTDLILDYIKDIKTLLTEEE
jgi:hypothetical protein